MNDVRDYKVLRPIDVDAINAEIEESPQETGPAYGNQFQGGTRILDELNQSAFWGRAQVHMSRPKPDSNIAKRMEQLRTVPLEQLLSGQIEVDDPEIFEKPLYQDNPIKPQPFILRPQTLNTYDSDYSFDGNLNEEDFTPTGKNFFASTGSDYIDDNDFTYDGSPQEIAKEAA